MSDKENLLRVLNLCYRFISFRLRTEKEIKDYLLKKREKYHLHDQNIEEITQILKGENLINDKEFINWFVKSRTARKQKSQWMIKLELMRHGIEKDLIDDFFSDNPLDEKDLVYAALEKKWPRWLSLDKKSRFKKSANFLARRGFGFDLIKKTIANFEEKG